jgi:hypothetical protein
LLVTCHSSLLLKFVFFVVVIQFVVFNDVEFDRVEADDFEFRTALFARDRIALIGVRINVHIRIAFGACSGWHFVSTSSAFRRSALPMWGDLRLEIIFFEPPTI